MRVTKTNDGSNIGGGVSDDRSEGTDDVIYEEFKGWNCPTTECTNWDELPEQAQKYVEYLEELTGVKVSILSVGPKRSSTLMLDR